VKKKLTNCTLLKLKTSELLKTLVREEKDKSQTGRKYLQIINLTEEQYPENM
jgi:hypothetical protein